MLQINISVKQFDNICQDFFLASKYTV